MLEKLLTLVSKYRNNDNLKLAGVLTKIAVDLVIIDQAKQLKIAQNKAKQVSNKLRSLMLYQHATQVDRLAQDLEAKIGEFEVEDPIEAVLKSYSLIHKIAEVQDKSYYNELVGHILNYVDVATKDGQLSDQQIINEVEKRSLGLSEQDKNYIKYALKKEFNLLFEDRKQKIAEVVEIEEEQSQSNNDDLIDFTKKVEQVKQDIKKQQKQKKEDHQHKWYSSFPTTPPVWGGFAYQAIVPYQQSSQINFWSLAESKQEDVLNKLGF